MVKWEPFELDENLEADIHHLASTVKASDFETAVINIHRGRVSFISLFDENDNQHFIKLIGSDWCELFDVPGGNDND